MSYTKGKWTLGKLLECNGLFMVKVLCPNKNTVVQLTIPTWVGREEIEANARLIAAAPELLEVLMKVNKWLVQNTAAANRPATLDKAILDVIAETES